MKGIKITFEGVTKRGGGNINSFEDLKKMILKLFNIPPNTNFTIKFSDDQTQVETEEKFQELCKLDKIIKFIIEVSQNKEPEKKIIADKDSDHKLIEKIDTLLNSKFQLLESKMKNMLESEMSRVSVVKPNLSAVIDDKEHNSNEYCMNCHNRIVNKKYQCVICDDITLCENCEFSHNEHPLIKFNLQSQYQSNMTRDEVIKYLKGVDDKEKRKPLLFSFLHNLFFKDKQTDFILKLYKKDHVNLFGVPLNSQYHFVLTLVNETNSDLNEPVYIIIKNNNGINISTHEKIERIEALKFIDIPFTIEPIKECRTFNIEIHIHTKENNIYYEPLALEIQSVEEKDLEKTNADLLLKDYDDIVKINQEDKIQIYRLIQNGCEKNAKEINKILGKYNLQVPEYEEEK